MSLSLLFCIFFAADPASHQFQVEVPPADLQGRESDELIVVLPVDFPKLLADRKIGGQFDPSSLRLQRIENGKIAEGEVSCRFDDDTLPEEYPSRVGRASETQDGLSQRVIRSRKGRIFNLEPASTRGRIVWSHRQQGDQPGRYQVSFRTIDASAALSPSPAPWIGDFDPLRRESGASLGGFAHFTVGVGDLNGDKLFDLVAGTEKGDILWFPNRGTPESPRFIGCRPLMDQAGPIDTGWYGAPAIFDWNADQLPDLLIGTSGNVILWWKNIGTVSEARWEYAGFVQAKGKRLEVPETPVAEDTNDIFRRDYYNQPWIGDLNGDEIPEIVTGGYTTGRIFLYRGVGRDARGIPQLASPEMLEANGEPIDTIWAAAPALHDLNGDGLHDLITGGWFWSGISRPPQPGEDDFLSLFMNVGPKGAIQFERRPFPVVGKIPRGSIARPSFVEINNDGLIDIVVNDGGGGVSLGLNEGTQENPRWNFGSKPLEVPWAFAKDFDASAEFSSLQHAGGPVMLRFGVLYSIEGGVRSPRLKPIGVAKVNGSNIEHPGPGYGDPYSYSILADWDEDGTPDLLWGTHQGEVYLHRKQPGSPTTEFLPGEKLLLTTGEPLHVGPRVVETLEEVKDFTILQGSRIVMNVTDFDQDGIADLMTTETYAKLQFFRGAIIDGERRLEPGVELLKVKARTESLVFTDWNRDGKPDLLLGGSVIHPVMVCLNTSTSEKVSLAAPVNPPNIPYVFWGPQVRSADWNGDGDEDLLIQSEFYSFWGERSFLERGYHSAKLLSFSQPISAE